MGMVVVIMTKKSMSFDDVATATVEKKNDYRTHFWGMAKTEPVSRMKDTELSGKTRRL